MPRLCFRVEQGRPRTTNRRLNFGEGRHQDVYVPGLDFLDGPGIQVSLLGQLLLRQPGLHPLPANVASEFFEFPSLRWSSCHALLGRA